MSSDADTLIRNAIAQGLTPETIIDAARGHLPGPSSPSADTSTAPVDTDETTPWHDGLAGEDLSPTRHLPATPAASAASAESSLQPTFEALSRYADLGLIGTGGMGEVHRVFDRRLGRQLALKILREDAVDHPDRMVRFLEEAQTTAQLEHPGIIPIHDLGTLPDGRVWFTMKEVTGQTFGAVIAEVHAASRGQWQPAASGWTLRRLVEALRHVCDAVGYAHSRGVVHRDLKPNNIMVGQHGEVIVLDWGLVKILGQPERDETTPGPAPVSTDRSRHGIYHTRVGSIAGTPPYMPPEQARGNVDQIDARADVYALGAVLYTILSGRAPYSDGGSADVLDQVISGPPRSLRQPQPSAETRKREPGLGSNGNGAGGKPLPASLVAACERAMARAPEDRFHSAAELAADLQAWLEGSKRREDARAVVYEARSKRPEVAALRKEAAILRAEAASLLEDIEDWRPCRDKLPGWAKEDTAAALEKRAELAEIEEERLLQGSLTHAPDLPEAHAALAARYRAEHEAAENAREDTTRAETLFRQHVAALPEGHADRPGHLVYLKGDGALTLVTDPPGAEVRLHRYVMEQRRLVPRFERSLGRTPLRAVCLPMGSYLCTLHHPGHAEVRYPVSIGRGEHWHGRPPGGRTPQPIVLPRSDELGPDDCYVPPGWFACGGDPHQQRSLPARRIWVDGEVFRRFPVTNTEYMAFLEALVAEGRTEEALRLAPRERAGTNEQDGALIHGFDGTSFSLRPDAEGDVWKPDWPVFMVTWYGAQAYAAWEAGRTGQSWRLPGELAREKAARGVDGRYFPWGDGFDPSWACMERSHPGAQLPAPVGAFPIDESVYGIRGLAGNVCEWSRDVFLADGPPERRRASEARTRPRKDTGRGSARNPLMGTVTEARPSTWRSGAAVGPAWRPVCERRTAARLLHPFAATISDFGWRGTSGDRTSSRGSHPSSIRGSSVLKDHPSGADPSDGRGRGTMNHRRSAWVQTSMLLCCATACGPSSAPEELFIGHSFFKPFAENMGPLNMQAGRDDIDAEVVFSGGASGSPQALWEDRKQRREIQGYLDGGNVDLFVMTYEPQYPSDEGYIKWFDHALENNPDTTFVLALPWLDFPESQDYPTASVYADTWHQAHDNEWLDLVNSLREAYPDNDVVSLPYGQSALELRSLFEADALPDVDALTRNLDNGSTADDAGIFVDEKGHPDEILVSLGSLVWGRIIYGIEPTADLLQDEYETDLAAVANAIVDEHAGE